MEVIVILMPLAILLSLSFIGAFAWMAIKGQYDDLETPKLKMLLDDRVVKSEKEE
jgi:cbb3-type cytochrome oxidase maturation protein